MASEVNRGGGPTITVSLSDVENANLTQKNFRSAADYTAFLDAVATARDQKAAGIADPKLEIPKPYGLEALGLLDDKLKQFAVLLGDSMLEVMKIMHEQNVLDRQVGRDTRKAEQQVEIAKMKEAADEIRAAGLARAIQAGIGGVMTMASGVVSGIGAGKAMKVANTPAGGATPGTTPGAPPGQTTGQSNLTGQVDNVKIKIGEHRANPPQNPTQLPTGGSEAAMTRQNLQANLTLSKWNAAGEVIKGAGQLGGAPAEYIASMHDAQRAELDAEAKKQSYKAQEADEIQRAAHEALASIRSTIQEIQRSISQTQSTIWA